MTRKALIVDDVQANRLLAAVLLRKQGWQTVEACDGIEAIEKLESEGFDAVLLDISMPRMTGEEVCRKIRANPRLSHLPVVAYTAHAIEEDKSRMIAIGFDEVLTKPISFKILQEVMDRLRPPTPLMPGTDSVST